MFGNSLGAALMIFDVLEIPKMSSEFIEFFRMSSKFQNPDCPRNYKLLMLILIPLFIEMEKLS